MLDIASWDHRTRLRVFSSVGGSMFALAWWLMVDAAVFVDVQDEPLKLGPVLWLPGVGSTLTFLIVVFMDWDALYADELTHFRAAETRMSARAILALAVGLGVSSVLGAVYILVVVYAGHRGVDGNLPDSVYPGVAIFLQTLLLFVGAFVMRLGRLEVGYD